MKRLGSNFGSFAVAFDVPQESSGEGQGSQASFDTALALGPGVGAVPVGRPVSREHEARLSGSRSSALEAPRDLRPAEALMQRMSRLRSEISLFQDDLRYALSEARCSSVSIRATMEKDLQQRLLGLLDRLRSAADSIRNFEARGLEIAQERDILVGTATLFVPVDEYMEDTYGQLSREIKTLGSKTVSLSYQSGVATDAQQRVDTILSVLPRLDS